MKRILLLILTVFIAFPLFSSSFKTSSAPKDGTIKVLILSGKNNHEWQKTTPILIRIFKESKLFTVMTTENPDTLSYTSFKRFELIVSNWNTWPDNKIRLSSQWENDFVRYVNDGGGVLSFHAGASSFYGWEDYHRIGIGRWGKETSHGPRTKGHLYQLNQNHPITKGMGPFYTMDEIWEKTDIYPGSTPIGSLSAKDEKDGHLIDVLAVFVNQTGKGRCFFTTLGHDERALLNTGMQTLLLRAAQWCARNEVTQEISEDLKISKNSTKDKYSWNKTDSALTLKNQSGIVWQYNFNNRFGKPYFHPLRVNHSDLTCVSPPDHPWHLGLWFSWKYINGINYWEYLRNFSSSETGFKSEGVTEISNRKIATNPDFSCDIAMKINYHPINGPVVLEEERNLHLSRPAADGSYYIDEDHLFKAISDSVLLDRTPIMGEPGGQSWGGYSGLSIRFNQDYTSPILVSPVDSTNLRKGDWLYMGFSNLKGEKVGISILKNPGFTVGSTSWYVIRDQNVPFYYYSPAVLFDHHIFLKRGELIRLKYRIWMLPGEISKEKLQQLYTEYLK